MDRTIAEIQRGLQAVYDSEETGQGRFGVSEVTLLGSGFETDVFAFTLTDRDRGAQDLILRVYAGEGASEKAAREFVAMSRLRPSGYPVPQILLLRSDPSPLGRPFVIMERIHGVSLGASYWSASGAQRQDLQALLCRLMVELHELNGSAILPDSPLADSQAPSLFLDHELSNLFTLLHRLEGREPSSLRGVLAWLSSRRSTVSCEHLAVVHGDFHPNNVLLRADGAPYVIDWSNVRLADYRTDLAWTWLINRLVLRATAQPDGGETELRLYERLAGKAVAQIEFFEVIASTRLLLSVLISLRFGAARQGMRPEAEALMRRDADQMQYVAALLQERTGITMSDVENAL
ncbi:MAG TPA: phosphotransferase [Chthonomonadaceae bacterium]|nr:phosphotransferase [Chthonomonadaceae bacterium]